MKKRYFLLIPITLLFLSGCSKDFLKSYERRIAGGTWELYDVNSFGIGGGDRPNFTSGRFTFESSGGVTYVNNQGEVYEGSWDIRRDWQQDDTQVKSLIITVVNFQTQDVISEYFDNMQFTGTNRFKAWTYNGGRTYTCKFRR